MRHVCQGEQHTFLIVMHFIVLLKVSSSEIAEGKEAWIEAALNEKSEHSGKN